MIVDDESSHMASSGFTIPSSPRHGRVEVWWALKNLTEYQVTEDLLVGVMLNILSHTM